MGNRKEEECEPYSIGSLVRTIEDPDLFPEDPQSLGRRGVALFKSSPSSAVPHKSVYEFSIIVPYGSPGMLVLGYFQGSLAYDPEYGTTKLDNEYKVLFKEKNYWVRSADVTLMKKTKRERGKKW